VTVPPTTQAPAAPQVKGAPIRGVLGAIGRVCPPGTAEKMLRLLPADVADAVARDRYLVAGWYPLAHYRAILDAAVRASSSGVELVRALSRDAMLHDLRGIYRLLTFVLSPETLMRRSPSLFGRYYDTGALSVPTARAGYCEARYSGCVGFDRVLWENVLGGASAVLEACGARDLKITVFAGGSDGDEAMTMIAEWR
jgi:hypothetical protein